MKKLLFMFLAFLAAPAFATTALTDGATVALNAGLDSGFSLTLAGDHTLSSPTNVTADALYTLTVTQDATGGHQLFFAPGYLFEAHGAPALASAAGAVDLFTFVGTTTGKMTLVAHRSDVSAAVLRPTGITATTNQTGQVTLSWTGNDGSATSYSVWLNDPVFGWGVIGTISSTTYVDTRTAGTYTYRVQATRGTAWSPYSDTADGTSN